MSKIKNFSIFFDNDEEFDNILGNTSYYIAMQNNISKLISKYNPLYLIDFGCGNGNTSLRIAKENPKTSIVAIDMREQIINFCGHKKEYIKVKNLTFVHGDLAKLENYNIANADIILFVYSFVYIPDPIENKKMYLQNLYSKMKNGAKVIIGEWFLNDTNTYNEANIKALYNTRLTEGANSIFWNTLICHSDNAINEAGENLDIYKKYHKTLIKKIIERKFIYPVSKKWLIETAKEIGFNVVMEHYINNVNDAVIVLKK